MLFRLNGIYDYHIAVLIRSSPFVMYIHIAYSEEAQRNAHAH